MKYISFLVFFALNIVFLPACGNADMARLIKPRQHKAVVVHRRPKSSSLIQAQRKTIVSAQTRPVYVPSKQKGSADCSYIIRDLSNPQSSKVWCRPAKDY